MKKENHSFHFGAYISPDYEVIEIEIENNILKDSSGTGGLPPARDEYF